MYLDINAITHQPHQGDRKKCRSVWLEMSLQVSEAEEGHGDMGVMGDSQAAEVNSVALRPGNLHYCLRIVLHKCCG